MSQRTLRTVIGLAGAGVAVTATAIAGADGAARPAAVQPARASVLSTSDDVLLPGGAVTGTLLITGTGSRSRRITDLVLAAPTSDACGSPGVVLAPTTTVTPETPLEVRPGSTAAIEWTAYMDGEGEQACQGAELTSRVLLDGEPAGTVTLTAGTLPVPPSPIGGATTGTRAAVRWSASTAAGPGWVLERAVAGTDDWQPACGSSPARPVRALACTDTGLTPATAYVYRVTLRTGHWRTTSRPGAPVRTQDSA